MPSIRVPVQTFTSEEGAVVPGCEDGTRVRLRAIRSEHYRVWLLGIFALAISYLVRRRVAVEGSVVLDERTARAAAVLANASAIVLVVLGLALVGGAAGLAPAGGLAIVLGGVELVLIVVARRARIRAVLDDERDAVTIRWRD
jgi:hypothetical protein